MSRTSSECEAAFHEWRERSHETARLVTLMVTLASSAAKLNDLFTRNQEYVELAGLLFANVGDDLSRPRIPLGRQRVIGPTELTHDRPRNSALDSLR